MVLDLNKFPSHRGMPKGLGVFRALSLALLLFGCTQVEYDNPYDPDGVNYDPNAVARYTSSSAESSSSDVDSSSSSDVQSSSSAESSSSDVDSSSSSDEPSSSSALSSSSLVPSSSSIPNVVYGTPITYGDKTYQTVVIGTQTWFAENLNYEVSGRKCYDNKPENCEEYGRLYDWNTAMTVCPSGWHLPSDADWDKLYRFVDENNGNGGYYDGDDWGYYYTVGRYLKATSGWNWNDDDDISGNGTDAHGFSALPGGLGYSDGSFTSVGYFGFWWSSNENSATDAYYRSMHYYNEDTNWDYDDKSNLFSVRCIKD